MRIVSICSPSHEVLRDRWFLPTVPQGFKAEVSEVEQLCPTGEYGSQGWREATLAKFQPIKAAIADHPNELILFSDVDVRFFDLEPRHLVEELGDCDIAFQREDAKGQVCTGLFVFRANEAVAELVNAATDAIRSGVTDDQVATNKVLGAAEVVGYGRRVERAVGRLLSANPGITVALAASLLDRAYARDRVKSIVSWKYLSKRFWTPGQMGIGIWDPGDALAVPTRMLAHHANWTVGIDNKLRQLEAVDAIVTERG